MNSKMETIRQFCALRSESISMQLANGETTSNMSYVDASALTLSDIGPMGGKGGFGGGMPDMGDRGSFGGRESSDGTTTTKPNADVNASSGLNLQGTSASTSESVPQNGEMLTMPGGFVGQMPNMGEIPEGFDPTQMPEDFDPPKNARWQLGF